MGMKKLVIYHAECRDGFCAAWVAWRKFGSEAEYMPARYGEAAPDVTGREVFIVDFSYDYETTVKLIEQANDVVILDHHKTAEEALGRIPSSPHGKPLIVFDMNRSGAGIARDFFEPGLDSWLVDYTQDRDLWRFALHASKEVNGYIGTLDQSFEAYERAHRELNATDAAQLGVGAEAYKNMYTQQVVKQARRERFAGHADIPIVNAPYVGISEVVGELAETALFAVGWFHRGDGRVAVSLRSRGDFDVSAVAKAFGGGGHKNAAGFTVSGDAVAEFIYLAGVGGVA